jgi:hypothetical protein
MALKTRRTKHFLILSLSKDGPQARTAQSSFDKLRMR